MASAAALENPKALSESAATALGGRRRNGDGVTSWASSSFDPFLNQTFVEDEAGLDDVLRWLGGRPAFVWMASDPTPAARGRLEEHGFAGTTFTGMEAHAGGAHEDAPFAAVGSRDELAAWHSVYSEVLGPDPRSVEDWHRLHAALGPDGKASLWLWVADVEGAPAATAALFVAGETAGLYCFATREPFRRRGLASALVAVCRERARRLGATRCVLQASGAGRPVYACNGFVEVEPLSIFVRR